ncbi:MAG: hypothetical protein QOJ13_86 [Gaiellales bacterium]|jgi:hypothetical protein|nr:hypothetical protein [Gaiellales bacterium]
MAGLDTAPDCIQHGISPVDGTVVPFENCTDGFFTFAPGGAFNPDNPGASEFFLGASTGTVILSALGFLVFLAVMVMWVKVENDKLTRQALRLRGFVSGPPPAPRAPGPAVTPEG